MPRQIGTSFQPGVDDQQGAFGSGGPRRAPTPGQSPIRLLNLRLPSVVGSRAPINQTLLTNPGGAALGDSQTAVMRALQAMSRPAGSVPPMSSPMAGGVSAPPVASQSYLPAAASPAAAAVGAVRAERGWQSPACTDAAAATVHAADTGNTWRHKSSSRANPGRSTARSVRAGSVGPVPVRWRRWADAEFLGLPPAVQALPVRRLPGLRLLTDA